MDTWSVRRPDHVQAGGVGWIPSPEGHVSDTHARVGALCPQTSEKAENRDRTENLSDTGPKEKEREPEYGEKPSCTRSLVACDI